MKFYLLAFSVLVANLTLQAQTAVTATDKEAAYTKTITSRAEKIVAKLAINDAAKSARVTSLVADQYRALNTVYTTHDEQVKAVKEKLSSDKEALAAGLKSIEETTAAAIAGLHKSYLAKLATELTEDQVVQIKDGMTYGVLPITYNGYLDMLPNLNGEQKKQIMNWLVEAREFAMSAESSEKKHWWFGKYKGRINNYLAAAGYDLKKEGEAWQKRRKDAAANNQ
ncbi:DUF3826 domain-containing protein [Flavisolibacter sp. BT320]|nr:DUF3826 domain-containing protein [Flavisolibacter longurius]